MCMEDAPMRSADGGSFEEFAEACAASLRRSAYLLCGDWHTAEDLVQLTLIKLYRVWPRISGRHQPLRYARKTLFRCWLNERRRPWRRAERRDGELPEATDPAGGPAAQVAAAGLRAELFGVLDALPPRQRAVLVLRFFDALSVGETARALGCSEGTVKSQTSRGLAVMRGRLTNSESTRELT
jgi:RNA polymerase sigma-70 factor (sigma-E family)